MARTSIDIIDETYIRAAPTAIREQFDDERSLSQIWPHLAISLVRDRGVKGLRWRIDGAVVGEMEVWIEPFWDGAIVHHYVRGEATSTAPSDIVARHRLRWKRVVHALKDSLEDASM